MIRLRTKEERVQRFLIKQKSKPGWDFSDAPDPRKEGMINHEMSSIIWSLELGLIANHPTLRDVEAMTKELAPWARKLVPAFVSDTTLDTEARRLDDGYLVDKLVKQVRDMQRSRMLKPIGLPIGVVTVDGKNLATLGHDAKGTGHERTSENEKWQKKGKAGGESTDEYYLMPALRAVLTSAEAKPCIYQMRLPVGTGESSNCKEFVDALHRAYGRSNMYEVLDFDAGLTSLETANHINDLGYGYVFGLKGNQSELFAEAERLLVFAAIEEEPEAETAWERRGGRRIRRRLWRTEGMRGFINSVGTWSHLRQTWLVKQETEHADGTVEVEDRYFISSLTWNRLSAHQILTLVRGHWGVENDGFNSLDLQWKEDHGPWVTKGRAVWALGVLRLMAYNVVQYLRKRRLRPKNDSGVRREPMSWRQVFRAITKAVEAIDLEGHTAEATY
jgi:hypothetical protein